MSAPTVILNSPAKINLGLRIHHRRQSDGYHYLSSIFIPISFADELSIRRLAAGESALLTTENLLPAFRRDDFERVTERGDVTKNLLYKAMKAVEAATGSLHVHLIKRIPSGAGLGGGSSNAGVFLKWAGRTSLNPPGDSTPSTLELARSLGADVPFFLQEKPALVFGTGDIMEEIRIGQGEGVLCVPPVVVPTGPAYAALKRALHTAPFPKTLPGLSEEVQRALRESDWERVRGLENDFESVVFHQFPELGRVKDSFYDCGAAYASLSGSGSALFAFARQGMKVPDLADRMGSLFPQCLFIPFTF